MRWPSKDHRDYQQRGRWGERGVPRYVLEAIAGVAIGVPAALTAAYEFDPLLQGPWCTLALSVLGRAVISYRRRERLAAG